MDIELHNPKGQAFKLTIPSPDSELINYKWQVNNRGYVYTNNPKTKKIALLHRLIMGAKRGQLIDHINGDPLDNRTSNLRFCTQSQNIQNSRKKRGCSLQYKGVCFNKRVQKWQVFITPPGQKQRGLGYFKTEREAALAYNGKAAQYFGEFAKLNVVE